MSLREILKSTYPGLMVLNVQSAMRSAEAPTGHGLEVKGTPGARRGSG